MKPIKIMFIFMLVVLTGCYPKFDFDSVDHYRIKITEKEVAGLYEGEKHSAVENTFLKVLNQDIPLTDKAVLAKYYTKHTLTRRKDLDILSSIYREKVSFMSLHSACIPNYRDVLVFKSRQDTIGISKICFECEQDFNVGFKNAEIQLTEGDFEEMQALLR